MEKKRALITGLTGQDGSYLAELLLENGYEVFGLVRRTSNDPFVRLRHFKDKITVLYGNLRDRSALEQAVQKSSPQEIYNLAAQSDVGISFQCPDETWEVNYHGLGRLAQVALEHNPFVRIYQASTSEMFGSTPPPQNEQSPFCPVSPYAKAKLKAHEDYVLGYRQHGKFIVSGFLFNHESPRRGEHFVTRKITLSLAKIHYGLQDYLELGNLEAQRDWGFAGDYVRAMWLILQQGFSSLAFPPRDFVIATGESHTVKEFVEIAARHIGLTIYWRGRGPEEIGLDANKKVRVRVNPYYYRPQETNALRGDASLARRLLNWQPVTSFEQLVQIMMEHDLELISKK